MNVHASRRAARRAHRLFAAFGAALFAFVFLFASRECQAASKEECLDAHARGQDLREHGQLTRAKQAFLVCAQRTCPGLVQADCARFGDDLDRLMPTVSFVARDGRGGDLPSTSIYVDDALVTSRLEDGRAYELDPGRHTVRFIHDGHEVSLTPVVNQGEKGRVLAATFPDNGTASEAPSRGGHPAPVVVTPTSHRSALPLVVAGLGAAALVTGSVLTAVGMSEVPSGCSTSTHECAASPSDPSLNDAHHAMALTNIGLGTGIAGAAVMIGGVVWYFVQPASTGERVETARTVAPWVAKGGGGLSVVSSF